MTAHNYLYLKTSHIAPRYHRPCFLQSVVTEQSTTCCWFYRQICHGDGCHPGRLPGASHPCSEDGRPLRARHASQTDVEAGGGGAAGGAGLNAEAAGGNVAFTGGRTTCSLSCMPSWVCSIEVILDKEGGKKLPQKDWIAHSAKMFGLGVTQEWQRVWRGKKKKVVTLWRVKLK